MVQRNLKTSIKMQIDKFEIFLNYFCCSMHNAHVCWINLRNSQVFLLNSNLKFRAKFGQNFAGRVKTRRGKKNCYNIFIWFASIYGLFPMLHSSQSWKSSLQFIDCSLYKYKYGCCVNYFHCASCAIRMEYFIR